MRVLEGLAVDGCWTHAVLSCWVAGGTVPTVRISYSRSRNT